MQTGISRKSLRFLPLVPLLATLGIGARACDCARNGAPQPAAPIAVSPRSLLTGARPQIQAAIAHLPLSFVAYKGASGKPAIFVSRGHGYTLSLQPHSAVLSLTYLDRQPHTNAKGAARTNAPSAVVSMQLVGGNPAPHIEGEQRLPGTVSEMLGRDSARWKRHLPTYEKVRYRDVYPGTDLVYYGNQGQLEYDFVLAPGSDPRRITMAFSGAKQVNVDPDGSLALRVPGGTIRQHRPLCYQKIGGRRVAVEGRYTLRGRHVGFQVARYDTSHPLVIDPVLSFSTYLGGGDYDIANAIAVDGAGNVWTTGMTYYGGSRNIFVRKLNPTGTTLLLDLTYGDGGDDEGSGIAIDANGNAYITGKYSFPYDLDPTIFLEHRVFVLKLSPNGDPIYFFSPEGSLDDNGGAIAVDKFGYAYVTGYAAGGHVRGFPIVRGFQTAGSAPVIRDGIVMVVNPAGNTIAYSTYIAGGSLTEGYGIAVDANQHIYVTGGTGGGIPITNGAVQTQYAGGGSDTFVMKIDPTQSGGASLVYSTYLGGGDFDQGSSIAIDAAGDAYITGNTSSGADGLPFPTTPGAFQTQWGGGDCDSRPNVFIPCPDAFVAKLDPTGSTLLYSTYLGGLGSDTGTGIAIDTQGNAYVTGYCLMSFPAVNSLQPFGGGKDAFVAKVNPTGTGLAWSTFLGGSDYDQSTGMARDTAGNLYVTGFTSSTNFPVTPGAFHPNYAGGDEDPFVVRIGDVVTQISVAAATGRIGQTVNLKATLTHTAAGTPLAGKTLSFQVASDNAVGTATTGADGSATYAYTIPAGNGAANRTITVSFAGNGADTPAAGNGTLTVTKAATTLYANPAAGSPGQTVTLAASLWANGARLPGKPVAFREGTTTLGSATTDNQGTARLNYALPANIALGDHTLTAAFDGDGGNLASSRTFIVTVKAPTALYANAITSSPGKTVALVSSLWTGANRLPGKTVTFREGATTLGTAVTDAQGVARLSYVVPAGIAPGDHTLTAAFAGDGSDLASSRNFALSIRVTTTLYTNPVTGARGKTVPLVGSLWANGQPLANQTLTFSEGAATFGTAITDNSGVARLLYAVPANAVVGTHTLTIMFAGNATYLPGSRSLTLTVN